jgi:hypothetical protein
MMTRVVWGIASHGIMRLRVIGFARSPSVQATCRACCVTRSAFGCAVHPARCTRRLPTSIKKRTYNRWSQTVSTVKKSTAMRPFA